MYSKKKYPTTKSLSKKIKHIENDLIENKFSDTYVPAINFDEQGIVFGLLDGITPSTSDPQSNQNVRDGTQIFPSSLQLRVKVTSASVPPGGIQQCFRMIVLWDKQPNGGQHPVMVGLDANGNPEPDSILDVSGMNGNVGLYAPFNYNAIERFKILHDKLYTLPQSGLAMQTTLAGAVTTTNTLSTTVKLINKYIKLGRKVKYANTEATAPSAGFTEILTNALYIGFITDTVSDTPTILPAIQGGFRVYFKDG